MIGYSDSRKDAGRLSAAWYMFKAQEDLVEVAKQYGVNNVSWLWWHSG
jgi:phosphoenolpyruvate carboxylase